METQSSADASTFLELTARIVASYVSNNSIAAGDLSSLIDNVHAALHGQIKSEAPPAPEPQKPAVPIRKSITPDYIICLDDGLQFKSLKRHLRTAYSMTPAQYREKWNLPPDYPMVAPNYAAQRSNLAKTMGLGRKRDVRVRIPEPEVTAAPAKPTRAKRKAKAS